MPLVDTCSPDMQKTNTSSQGALPLVVAENNNKSTQGAMPPVVADVDIKQRGNRGGLNRSGTTSLDVTKARSLLPHEEGLYSLSGGRSGSLIFRLCQEKLEQAVSLSLIHISEPTRPY